MKRGMLVLLGSALLVTIPALAAATVVTLPITQAWQHKDTNMLCAAGGSAVPHVWNHATTPAPGCPHCGYYCAPASISMYATYRGRTGVFVQQDDIYDAGKFTQGEIQANGILETHGVGMFDGVSPGGVGGAEVQAAFQFAVGALVQWGVNVGRPAMTGCLVIANIDDDIPILWCDHYGYPPEVYPALPDEWAEVNGHAKIVAGYDDRDTADCVDDLYYIYDPWPASGSPYWTPAANVLDVRDVYMTDYDVIPTDDWTWGGVKNLFR